MFVIEKPETDEMFKRTKNIEWRDRKYSDKQRDGRPDRDGNMNKQYGDATDDRLTDMHILHIDTQTNV